MPIKLLRLSSKRKLPTTLAEAKRLEILTRQDGRVVTFRIKGQAGEIYSLVLPLGEANRIGGSLPLSLILAALPEEEDWKQYMRLSGAITRYLRKEEGKDADPAA